MKNILFTLLLRWFCFVMDDSCLRQPSSSALINFPCIPLNYKVTRQCDNLLIRLSMRVSWRRALQFESADCWHVIFITTSSIYGIRCNSNGSRFAFGGSCTEAIAICLRNLVIAKPSNSCWIGARFLVFSLAFRQFVIKFQQDLKYAIFFELALAQSMSEFWIFQFFNAPWMCFCLTKYRKINSRSLPLYYPKGYYTQRGSTTTAT